MEPYVGYRRVRLLSLALVWLCSVLGFFILWETVEYFFFPVIPKHVMKQLYLFRDLFTAVGSGALAIWLFLKEDRRFRKEKVRLEKLAVMQAFSSYVVHEIRNPLASLSLNTELLVEESARLDPPRREEFANLLQPVMNSIRRITEITEICFGLSRRTAPSREPFDPLQALEEAVRVFESKAAEQGVRIVMSPGDAPVPRLAGNCANFREAFTYLVRNSIEAMPQGGELEVRFRRKRRRLVIELKDTGVGMTQEVEERLFDPFFTTKLKSRGLGLCLAWQLLGEFAAKISTRSKVDKGTTFQFEFPLVE